MAAGGAFNAGRRLLPRLSEPACDQYIPVCYYPSLFYYLTACTKTAYNRFMTIIKTKLDAATIIALVIFAVFAFAPFVS